MCCLAGFHESITQFVSNPFECIPGNYSRMFVIVGYCDVAAWRSRTVCAMVIGGGKGFDILANLREQWDVRYGSNAQSSSESLGARMQVTTVLKYRTGLLIKYPSFGYGSNPDSAANKIPFFWAWLES